MKNVSEHIVWVRKMIMEEGMMSFVQCPISDKIPNKKCQSTHVPLLPTCQGEGGKIIDVLMPIILNVMTQEAVI